MNKLITLVAFALVMSMGFGMAEESTAKAKKGQGRQEMQLFRTEMKKARTDFRAERMEARKALKESLKGKEPQEIISALKDFATKQYAAWQAFAQSQHEKRVAFIQEKGKDEAKVNERLVKTNEAYAKITAHRTQQHEENVAKLDELAGQTDLSKEALKKAIKDHLKTQHSENKEFRKGLRETYHPKKDQQGE